MFSLTNKYQALSITQFEVEDPLASNHANNKRLSLLKKAIIGVAAVGVFAGAMGGIVKAAMMTPNSNNSTLTPVQDKIQSYTSENSAFNATATPFANISTSTNVDFTPPLPAFNVTVDDIAQGTSWLDAASSTPKASSTQTTTIDATEPTALSATSLSTTQVIATKPTENNTTELTALNATDLTTTYAANSTSASIKCNMIFDANSAKCLRFEIAQKDGSSKILLENHCLEDITASVGLQSTNSTITEILPAGAFIEKQISGTIDRQSFRFGKGQCDESELKLMPDFFDKVKWIADPAIQRCGSSLSNYKPLYANDKSLFSPNGLPSQIIFHNKGAYVQHVQIDYKSGGKAQQLSDNVVAGLDVDFDLPADATDVKLYMYIYRFYMFGSERKLSNNGHRTLKDNIYTSCDNTVNVMQLDSWGTSGWVYVSEQHPEGYYPPSSRQWKKHLTYNNGVEHTKVSNGHPAVDQRAFQRWNPKADRPSPKF